MDLKGKASFEARTAHFEGLIPVDGISLESLADGVALAEGPVWVPEEGHLLFSEVGLAVDGEDVAPVNTGRRLRWSAADGVSVEQDGTSLTNGMTRDRQGRLLCCELGARRVTRRELDGSVTVVASSYRGARLSGPNDVVVKSDGSIYFTDTGGLNPGGDIPYSAVFRVSDDLAHVDLLANEFVLVNGLAFSPDETVLYVNDTQSLHAHRDMFRSQGTIRAYDVRKGGMLCNSRLFAELRGTRPGIADGMKTDVLGNVYCTGPGGVWVFSPDGMHAGTIITEVNGVPLNATNLAWGGPEWKTLFITTTSGLLKTELSVAGVAVPPAVSG